MDSVVFGNLVRGNRLTGIMNLRMTEGVPHKYAKDYTFVEIPLNHLFNPSTDEIQVKALRNQRLRIVPACTVDLKKGGYKIGVKVNPKLLEYASCPSFFILDTEEHEQPVPYAFFHKDMEANELDWAVRLYLMG